LGGLIPQAHFTTSIILLLNFGLYAATALYSVRSGDGDWMGIGVRTLYFFGAKFSAAIAAGEWWRLITAGFLHGGLFHIFMNSWVLYDLGAQVEEAYGTRRFLVFYFVSTVFGFLASSFWFSGVSVGASAGLFGLIGAMIALGVRYRSSVNLAIRRLYVRWAIYGLLFGLLPGLRVDNAAHLGGLAAGFACAYLVGAPAVRRAWLERLLGIAAAAAVLLTVYGFLQVVLLLRLRV
jgi:rhomboid protease GluP